MHAHIIRALIAKEWQRHVANRGGIALGVLLVAAAVLLSVSTPRGAAKGSGAAAGLVGGVNHCMVHYDKHSVFITHLMENVPVEMKQQIHFQPLSRAQTVNGVIVYPVGTGGVQVRELRTEGSLNYTIQVSVWHPEGNPTALAPYEAWLWKEFRRWNVRRAQLRGVAAPPEPAFDDQNQWLLTEAHLRFRDQVAEAAAANAASGAFEATAAAAGAPLAAAVAGVKIAVPDLEVKREGLGGEVLTFHAAIVTGLVVFALYFTCVYLLPTLNCEERERGVLLAQALSPASPLEIVAAKALFYPAAGVGLAATIAAVYQPSILAQPFFWLSLVAVAAGFLGIGMTISTLARTQRAAFLGGMCYLMAVSMLLTICSLNNIPILPYFTVEYFGPRILHAAISSGVNSSELTATNWWNLLGAALLGSAWLAVAVRLFRRRGWQ